MAVDHRSKRRKPAYLRAKMRNVSMPPVLDRALVALAGRAGHENESRIVQELVAREAIYQFGPEWADRFAEADEPVESRAA